MEIKKAEFAGCIGSMKDYADRRLPEIAVAGRSNVGKSSLINLLCNRDKLAKTSSTPGKTRTLNFYIINSAFILVDLPGYGYAEASKKEKTEWGRFIEEYFDISRNLVHLLILVDIRHEPTENDVLMVNYAKSMGIPYTVVITKCDKASRHARGPLIEQIVRQLRTGINDIIIFSARDGEGKKLLAARLESAVQARRA